MVRRKSISYAKIPKMVKWRSEINVNSQHYFHQKDFVFEKAEKEPFGAA